MFREIKKTLNDEGIRNNANQPERCEKELPKKLLEMKKM